MVPCADAVGALREAERQPGLPILRIGRGDVFDLGRAPLAPASSVSITRMSAPLPGVNRVARRPAAFK
jgi:hypothetical protein